jgi:hypothetical protein
MGACSATSLTGGRRPTSLPRTTSPTPCSTSSRCRRDIAWWCPGDPLDRVFNGLEGFQEQADALATLRDPAELRATWEKLKNA